MYQGWNDYPLRPGRALDYLAAVEQENGGAKKAAEFFRLFMVPGMLHCAGGPGPWQADYVDPLVEWREKGKAPERIVGTHPAGNVEPGKDTQQNRAYTRPLCPYPKYAKYTGRGDVKDERNFRCVED
jgi:feruloyl esterase